MNRLQGLVAALLALGLLTGGNCSRARVKSMNHMNQGIVYAQRQDYHSAKESLQKATSVDPTNHQAFYNLALVHVEQQKFSAAREALNRAISVDDSIAGYHEKLGSVLMELEKWEEAKKAFEKALERDKELFKAYYKLAQVHERLDDQQNALHQYTKAIEKGPRFLPAYQALGRLYANLDYLDRAAQVLNGGLEAAPEGIKAEADLRHLLGTVYQQQGKYEDAIAEFESALDIKPGMNEALFSLGWTYSLTDNREEARRYLKKFVNAAGASDKTPDHYVTVAQDRLNTLQQGP